MQTIRTPDGQVFKFPDTMTRAQIAEALKRRLGNQTVQQQSNPAGTGITRGIARGAVQTAAAPFTIAATADVRALGDIGKSEDAIRYDEAIRAGVPTQAFASRAANISDPRQVNAMMQQYGVSPAANVNYQQVVDRRLERRADAAQNPEEYLKRLSENSATAGRLFKLADSFARSPTADAYAKSLAEAPDGFKGWLSTVTDDPLGFMAFMGETIAESAPQIGAGLATSVVTGSPAAGATVMSLGGFSREYANEVNNFLRENGIDLADPESAKKLFSSPELMDKANERGVTRGLVIAAADFAGQGLVAQQVIRKSLKRQAVAQGGSEGAGEALATKAVGDAFSFKETITEALAGTGSTIPEAAVAKTLFNKDGKLASADDLSTLPISEKLAAADVARMLDEISKANGYKLKNVDPSSNKGAKQTLEDARSSNVQAINDLKDVLKKKLDKKNAQSLEELLSVYSEAAAGIGAGKKKVSQKVTVSQLQALEGLVGDTKEGQQLLQELLKSNVITDLFKDGMKGGISQFTDLFNPISHTGAVYDPARMANVVVGGLAGYGTGGVTLGIAAGGRVVDFFTGRRSKVASFVKNNKEALGLPAPEGTSLIEQKNRQKADAKDRRAAIAQIATILDAPKAGFVENILLGTGLDRSGLETVLNNMASDFGSNPDFVALLDDIQKNLDGEGVAYLDNLSELIPVIGVYAQRYHPDLVTNTPDNPLLKRSFDSPNVQTNVSGMGGVGANTDTSPQFGTPQFTTQENYNRGIQANRQAAETLAQQAQNDPELDLKDKAVVASALDQLQFNLGSEPTINAQAIFEKAKENVNEDVAVKYIKPYVDRVVRQQRSNPVQEAPEAGVAPDVDTDTEDLGQKIANIFNRNKDPDSKLSQTLNTADLQPNVPELWTTPPQAYDSAATSINQGNNPAGYTKLKKMGVFKEGQTVVDIGGGRFDNVVDELAKEGVTVKIYDPFNRTPEHNAQVASEVADGKADVAVSNNTLNVIQEPENINRVIRQAHNAIPTGAKAYFTIYERDGSGVGVETSKGWQRNEKTQDYIPRIEEVFGTGNVERNGKVIIATKEDAPVRLSQQSPILQQPEIPRGETTNILMPNTLGSAFEFAKNSNFRTGRDFKLALQEKALEAQENEGIDLSEFTEENVNRLSDYVVADALEALKNNANAIGWYDRTVTEALETLGEVYPEILTNPTNKLQFIWALAVTSNGTKVDKNFELAATAYDTLQRTGRFPAKIGIGDSAKQIDLGLAQYHTMLEKFDNDHGRLEDFMTSQSTVRELENTYNVKIPDESKDTVVRGAAILGAKIGNGFFSNLYGYFDALTMDRWLMRTVGRHRGTLIKINEPMIKKKHGEIKSIFTNSDKDTLKSLRAYLKPSGIRLGKSMTRQDMNDLAFYIAKQSTKKPWREGLNEISNDLRKSANGLAGYLDGQVEQPAGGGERNFIRSIFNQALDRINADPAVSRVSNAGLTMSDLQALLWYPEKLLYDSSKAPEGQESRGYKDDEAPDYANAARKFVEKRKEMAVGGRLGSTGAAGDGGRGATSPDARLSQGILSRLATGARNLVSDPSQREFDFGRTLPSNQEFKSQTELASVPFEVGKKGSKYENGLKDYDSLRRLAEAYMITLKAYKSQRAMAKENKGTTKGTAGVFNPDARSANYLVAGAKLGDTRVVEPNQAYMTALHEVVHGIASADLEGYAGGIGEGMRSDRLNKVKRLNYLNLRNDPTFEGTFEDEIAKLLDVPDADKTEIISEIINLQDAMSFMFPDGTNLEVRDLARSKEFVAEKTKEIAQTISKADADDYVRRMTPILAKHQQYTRGVYEMSVDPIIFYLYNPKEFRVVAPKTAKMIRDFFKESSTLQFYNHPLALGAAVVLAIMMKQEQAEEEDQQRGILNPRQAMQAGALTI